MGAPVFTFLLFPASSFGCTELVKLINVRHIELRRKDLFKRVCTHLLLLDMTRVNDRNYNNGRSRYDKNNNVIVFCFFSATFKVVQKTRSVQMFCVRSSSSAQCSYSKSGGVHPHHSLACRKQQLCLIQTRIFLATEQCQQRTTFHTHKRRVCETDCHKSAGNTFQMLRESVITEHDTSVITEGWKHGRYKRLNSIFWRIRSGRVCNRGNTSQL